MPNVVDLTPYNELIMRLFIEDQLPIAIIASHVTVAGQSVSRARLRRHINELGLTREHSPLEKNVYYSSTERRLKELGTCRACGEKFSKTVAWQETCRICIPTRGAGQRYKAYGITQPQFEALLREQRNICAICPRMFDVKNRQLVPHVDHDHKTGRVRGLLCASCNVRLSGLEDHEWAQKANVYLSPK